MTALVTKRRSRRRKSDCTHVTPRPKPSELLPWIARGLNSLPRGARPGRAELHELLRHFQLSRAERDDLVRRLEQEISWADRNQIVPHFGDLYKGRGGRFRRSLSRRTA
jgi:hypothetical protein